MHYQPPDASQVCSVLNCAEAFMGLQEEHSGARAVTNLLTQTYKHDIVTSESMLRDGISNIGTLANMQKFVHKLVSGTQGSVSHMPCGFTNIRPCAITSWDLPQGRQSQWLLWEAALH